MKKYLSALSLTLATLSTSLSGTAPAIAATPVRGGTLQAIVQPEPTALTSSFQNTFPNLIVSANIFDGLLTYDKDSKPQPGLAQRWEVADDGLTMTFHLRHGVKWHDGKPFTAADVKFSLLQVWKKLHTRGRVTFAPVTSVDTPDEHTVVLHLAHPSIVILSALNAVESQIIPKHIYEGTDFNKNPANIHPIGTGAFRFKQWNKGQYIELERNPDYWDSGKPYLDTLIFRIIPDAGSRAVALETGEVQYAPYDAVPHSDVKRLEQTGNLKVTTDGFSWQAQNVFLEFNLRNPILNNLKVRQAIAHAIDVKDLIKTVWYGFGKPATGMIPSSLTDFYTTKNVPQYPFDPQRAEALLDEAGYPRKENGVRFSLKLDYQPFNEAYKFHSEYLRQKLKAVGVEVTVRNQDLPTFIKRIYTNYDFDINTGQISPYLDPQIGGIRHYWSKSIAKGVPWTNASNYSNPKADNIIERIQTSNNPQERFQLFHALQRIGMQELPVLPLFEIQHFTLYSNALHGVGAEPDAAISSLKNIWIAP